MQIGATYSHLNGKEFLLVHHLELWNELMDVIAGVDAEACRTKVSNEKRTMGKVLYSPVEMNKAFTEGLNAKGWRERRNAFWVTDDDKLMRAVHYKSVDEQKSAIKAAQRRPIMSYNQTDFIKQRVAVEVQFGKYAFVAHDLFVKHMSFFVADIIDVGIEILPMKSLEEEMSSGVAYYERDLLNVIRQGRAVPAVPLVLIGIKP